MTDPKRDRLWQRILVVDDDEDSRYVTSVLLAHAGYLVDGAADGEEAWEALLTTSYDLLVTDHNMPRLSGLDLVARLRAAGMSLPVILHSGWPGLGGEADYLSLRLTAVIRKSTNFAELRNAVNCILSMPSKDGLLRQGVFRPAPHNPSIKPWSQPVEAIPCKRLLPDPSI
jgi:CheY-like chemotaxis protein